MISGINSGAQYEAVVRARALVDSTLGFVTEAQNAIKKPFVFVDKPFRGKEQITRPTQQLGINLRHYREQEPIATAAVQQASQATKLLRETINTSALPTHEYDYLNGLTDHIVTNLGDSESWLNERRKGVHHLLVNNPELRLQETHTIDGRVTGEKELERIVGHLPYSTSISSVNIQARKGAGWFQVRLKSGPSKFDSSMSAARAGLESLRELLDEMVRAPQEMSHSARAAQRLADELQAIDTLVASENVQDVARSLDAAFNQQRMQIPELEMHTTSMLDVTDRITRALARAEIDRAVIS